MKQTKFLIACLFFTTLILQSCGKADPLANLTGKYIVSDVKVDAVGSTGSGFVSYNAADKTGDLDLTYRVDNFNYILQGTDVIYTATEDIITWSPGSANQIIWKRIDDSSKSQTYSFTQVHEGKNRTVEITVKK